MFGKYMDVGEKRDMFGAFVFYFAHLMMLVGFSTVMVHFLGMAGFVDGSAGSFFEGSELYTMVGTMFVLWLGGTMLSKREATNDFMSIIVFALSVYLAYTTGVVFGLVPIALLTTMSK